MKRAVSLLIAAVFALALLLPCGARAQSKAERELAFDADGTFRIMLIADIQEGVMRSPYLADAMAATIAAQQPDLIVLLGDQLDGWYPLYKVGNKAKLAQDVIDRVMAPILESGVPFLVTLGNHDSEMGLDRDEMISMYEKYDTCLNVNEDILASLPGGGTCNVPVRGTDGSVKLNLFAVDSLDYDGEDYACVSAQQVNWCTTVTQALERETGSTVPAMVFQHIVVPEIYDALTECAPDSKGSFEGSGSGAGRWFLYASNAVTAGAINEAPCPPVKNEGQFAAWVENGDVFAAFFGHDHTNTFTVPYMGVDLVAVPGSTFHSYADAESRGVRMVELNESNVRAYDTWLVSYRDYIDMSGTGSVRYHLLFTDEYAQSVVKQVILLGLAALALIAIVIICIVRRHKRKKAALLFLEEK